MATAREDELADEGVGDGWGGKVCSALEAVRCVGVKAVAAGAIVALPKFAVKGMGWTTYMIDTEKNIFGLFQQDAAAA